MDDEDSYKLECSVCQRLLHYRCTELPLYQLQHFMTKSYRKFVCTNCTTVEQWLIDTFPNENLQSPMKKTTELSQALKNRSTEIKVLIKTNMKLTKKNNDIQAEINKKKERSKKGRDEHTKLQAEVMSLNNCIQMYEEEISSLHTAITEQVDLITNLCDRVHNEVAPDTNITKLEIMMEKKLAEVEQSLKKSLLEEVNKNNTMLNDKLNEVI